MTSQDFRLLSLLELDFILTGGNLSLKAIDLLVLLHDLLLLHEHLHVLLVLSSDLVRLCEKVVLLHNLVVWWHYLSVVPLQEMRLMSWDFLRLSLLSHLGLLDGAGLELIWLSCLTLIWRFQHVQHLWL